LNQIRAEEGGLIELVQSSVGRHLELIESWPTIIETAKELRQSSEVASAVARARFSR
jgi:hypothetical protein